MSAICLHCLLCSLFVNIICNVYFRDEKEKEHEGETHETDFLSKYNNWSKETYSSFLARCIPLNFAYLCLAYHWAFLENTGPFSVNRVLS